MPFIRATAPAAEFQVNDTVDEIITPAPNSARLIILFGVIAGALLILASILCLYFIRDVSIKQGMSDLKGSSLLLAADADQKLISAKLLLDVLAEKAGQFALNSSLADYEKKIASEDAFNFLKDHVGQNELIDVATFVAKNGRVRNFTRSYPPPEIYLGDRDYFMAHKNNPQLKMFYSLPVKNRGNGKWVFYMSRRIDLPDGEMAGLVLVGLSVEKFSELYRRFAESLGPGASISLYNTDNILMTRWPIKDDLIGQHNPTSVTAREMARGADHAVVLAKEPRFTEGNSVEPRIVAPRRLMHFPFVVTPVITESIYLAKWKVYAWFICGFMFLGLLFLAYGLHRLLKFSGQRDRLLDHTKKMHADAKKTTAQLLEAQRQQEFISLELKALNQSLESRITERTEALRIANGRLESYSYSVAHDLRAPLRLIISYAQILKKRFEKKLPPEASPFINKVIESGVTMADQIEGLLCVASAGQKTLERQRVDLSILALKICAELIHTMKVIRKVQTQISPGISADCDPVLIGLVLQNLLSNALKYSGKTDHPVVEFGMLETGGVCQYYVRDNGAGFNTEHAQRLFQPFKRLHAASEFPGIGIGLATVNAIIERHQGKVWAESKPGVQTTFWFTLG